MASFFDTKHLPHLALLIALLLVTAWSLSGSSSTVVMLPGEMVIVLLMGLVLMFVVPEFGGMVLMTLGATILLMAYFRGPQRRPYFAVATAIVSLAALLAGGAMFRDLRFE